ncbi:MAG: hypothetical protein ACPLSX_01305 [Arcobacter sp.]|uniref:hypothetical protein n=1 Tax=Arcobacter sp. TaxID=1872629 RepID=UPI003C769168
MLIIASKIVFWLLAVAIIAMYIGFLIGKLRYKKRQVSYEINPILRKPGNIYNKPFILGNPRPTGKDDLKVIEGIDHQMENKLNALGIFHVEQIAKWSEKNIDWIEEYFSIDNRVGEEQWVEKAKAIIKR